MLIRPDRGDLRIIGFYVGKIVFGIGLLQLAPLAAALVLREWDDASGLTVGAAVAVIIGRVTEVRFRTAHSLDWSHGLVTVALAWLVGPMLLSIPLYLSGHYNGMFDAFFEAMSGLTDLGWTLTQDLDHLSAPIQYLRHLSQFAGGQGIVVVMLTVFANSNAQIGTLYVGEARDDRIVPNIVRTARFIYLVAFVYLLVGTTAFWLAGLSAGLTPGRAFFHGVNLFMAAFDTGGFTPYSLSIAYYHSAAVEGVAIVLMLAGSMSFGIHFLMWRARYRDALRNFELRTYAVTAFSIAAIGLIGLGRSGAYTDVEHLFRKGVFTYISGHTSTGFSVTPSRLFATEWGLIAPAALVIAMALGGMASSTAGGIKVIRVGLAAKSVFRDIRRVLAPESSVVLATYHSQSRIIISDVAVRSAVSLIILFLLSFLGGALLGVYYGFPFHEAMFEATSAGVNTGLSIGIIDPELPSPMKVMYLVQMYLGRLEFMSAFAMVGYGVALVRGQL